MLKEYHKISNVFKFDPKYKSIIGLNDIYEALKNIKWIATEKVDGTNVRIYWDGHEIIWKGRTDKSEMPKELDAYLKDIFGTKEMEYIFEQTFGDKETIIFGEGYGRKIQTNGEKYIRDGVGFVIFDIMIDNYYLSQVDLVDVATKLGLATVPVVYKGNLIEMIKFVADHKTSRLSGTHEMEGVVIKPAFGDLYDKTGKRVIGKIKYRDMLKDERYFKRELDIKMRHGFIGDTFLKDDGTDENGPILLRIYECPCCGRCSFDRFYVCPECNAQIEEWR